MITLRIRPGQTYKNFADFIGSHPPFSIALDGIVAAPSERRVNPCYANFNHHEGVDRLSTRSTCEQVYIEINMGLFEVFRKDGIPTAQIYVNDCDEDVCLSVWLLLNHEKVIGHANPAINRLVHCEDRLDTTGGGYPLGDTSMTRKMAWIFAPYNMARFSGLLKNMNHIGMQGVIEAVCARIDQHVLNGGQELALEGEYERIGGDIGWTFVKERGPAARRAMYIDGINAFVSLVGKNGENHVYTIGRRSAWTPFNIERIIDALNNAECDALHVRSPKAIFKDFWGPHHNPSATIGGSPRESGSFLTPEVVEKIVNENKGY
jgi:hypothetical protein